MNLFKSQTPELDRAANAPLLPSGPNDRYFDYCLEPYEPRRPWRGRLRGENLLWDSLGHAGLKERFEAPLHALQRSLGPDMTVWGVKWNGTRLFWELYFYDPRKQSEAAQVGALARTLAPWFQLVPRVPETVPYMMASFDLSEATLESGRIEELNLYLTGEAVHAGRSYKLRAGSAELENTYRFFPAKLESDAVVQLLKSSLFVDYSRPDTLSKVLIPELFACKKICVSKKRTCDAIYYSGISVEQLGWFLKRFGYPPALRAFVDAHQEEFEHLFFDVGIDYRMDAGGTVVYPKTSYYGTL